MAAETSFNFFCSAVSTCIDAMNFQQSSSAALAQQAKTKVATATAVPASPYGTLYVLRGVVGCGKTTYAQELARLAREASRYYVVEGTDKYLLQGMALKQANAALAGALRQAQSVKAANKIVILETCSEYFDSRNVLGVNFSGWHVVEVWVNFNRRLLRQYLAWTLRNVVSRNDALLTVSRSSLPTCIRTHLAKARAYYGRSTPALAFETCPLEPLLKTLKVAADEYQKHLDENKAQYAPKLVCE